MCVSCITKSCLVGQRLAIIDAKVELDLMSIEDSVEEKMTTHKRKKVKKGRLRSEYYSSKKIVNSP